MSCSKFLLFAFNLIFALSGLALIVVGVIVLKDLGKYGEKLQSEIPASPVALIAAGCIIFVVAFFGCCGAIRESVCMLITFAVLLFAIFLVEIIAGILLYVNRDVVGEVLKKELEVSYKRYTSDEEYKALWDSIQSSLKCCGHQGPSDWAAASNIAGLILPESCCNSNTLVLNQCLPPAAYTVGCDEQFDEYQIPIVYVLAGIAIGFAFIEVLGIVLSWCLISGIRKQTGYKV